MTPIGELNFRLKNLESAKNNLIKYHHDNDTLAAALSIVIVELMLQVTERIQGAEPVQDACKASNEPMSKTRPFPDLSDRIFDPGKNFGFGTNTNT